jgi:hypothetical protein
MFKRRKPLTLIQLTSEVFWPSMGWKRAFIYAKHRLLRIADTTHSLALGLAIGMGVSFTPLLGTHFIQAGVLALIMRGNAFSAMMGTFFGNPWTFPFIWWSSFSLGRFLFGVLGIQGAEDLPSDLDFSGMWELAKTHPMELFLPWMLGGYIMLFLVIPPAYFAYFQLVRAAKRAKVRAKSLRQAKRKEERLKAASQGVK